MAMREDARYEPPQNGPKRRITRCEPDPVGNAACAREFINDDAFVLPGRRAHHLGPLQEPVAWADLSDANVVVVNGNHTEQQQPRSEEPPPGLDLVEGAPAPTARRGHPQQGHQLPVDPRELKCAPQTRPASASTTELISTSPVFPDVSRSSGLTSLEWGSRRSPAPGASANRSDATARTGTGRSGMWAPFAGLRRPRPSADGQPASSRCLRASRRSR